MVDLEVGIGIWNFPPYDDGFQAVSIGDVDRVRVILILRAKRPIGTHEHRPREYCWIESYLWDLFHLHSRLGGQVV